MSVESVGFVFASENTTLMSLICTMCCVGDCKCDEALSVYVAGFNSTVHLSVKPV